MDFGLVRETTPQERRVPLTPEGARALVAAGHGVIVRFIPQNGTQTLEECRASDFPKLVAGGKFLQPGAVRDIGPHGRQRGYGATVIEAHQHVADVEDERLNLHRAKWS